MAQSNYTSTIGAQMEHLSMEKFLGRRFPQNPTSHLQKPLYAAFTMP
jgi:hypothetical protein